MTKVSSQKVFFCCFDIVLLQNAFSTKEELNEFKEFFVRTTQNLKTKLSARKCTLDELQTIG
jgi:phage gp16-like protein